MAGLIVNVCRSGREYQFAGIPPIEAGEGSHVG
jgi:hypothetical protein